MDLSPLRIDRKPAPAAAATGRARPRRPLPIGGVVALLVIGGTAWLLWPRLSRWIDLVRLPEVEIALAQAPTSLAVSSASGTAANGYVVASKRAALSADTPGRIVELNVTEGSVVKQGFVVARLYADEYRAALERAQAEQRTAEAAVARSARETEAARAEVARLERSAAAAAAQADEARATHGLARIKLERAEKMVADDVESRQWLDDARAEEERAAAAGRAASSQAAAAEAAVVLGRDRVAVQEALEAEAKAAVAVASAARDLAQATLDKTEVRAPFDGVVVLKDAEVGEVVSPNSQGGNSRGSVATMVDFASLEVQVEMPERTIAAVAVGAAARIFLDAFPDHAYAGEVTRIWPTANRSKATIEVRVRFREPDERLRPEMGARVVFLAKGSDAAPAPVAAGPAGVLVPERALQGSGADAFVWRLQEDRVSKVAVRAAEPGGGRVLVTAGLALRDRVVVDPPAGLADGDRVRQKEQP